LISIDEIEDICKRAIVLPDCPVKKQHAIAQRAWLKTKIIELLQRDKLKPFDPRTETK